MDRRLGLNDSEIFLFRTCTFNENDGQIYRGIVKMLGSKYACTSNEIAEKKKDSLGRLSPSDLPGLVEELKDIYGANGVNAPLTIVSDWDFKNDYHTEGIHGETYDVNEFGVRMKGLKEFKKCLLDVFGEGLEISVFDSLDGD